MTRDRGSDPSRRTGRALITGTGTGTTTATATATATDTDISPGPGPAPGPGRRLLLRAAGGMGAGLLLGACAAEGLRTAGAPATGLPSAFGSPGALGAVGGPGPSGASGTPGAPGAPGSLPSPPPPAPQSGADATYTGDLRLVALSAALEHQAVGVYAAALTTLRTGRLGSVPAALESFLTKAMAQHADHATAWNGVLTGAGRSPLTGVPLSNQREVASALEHAGHVSDVAKLALQLEEQAAQTCLFAAFEVKDPAGARTAATVAPVEAMHVAVLRLLLGRPPVPDALLPVDRAAGPTLLTV
ncbi:ferritin-like domain-containing protein [Streptomyces sp. NPDC001780]